MDELDDRICIRLSSKLKREFQEAARNSENEDGSTIIRRMMRDYVDTWEADTLMFAKKIRARRKSK